MSASDEIAPWGELETIDVLYRTEDRIHRWSCRYVSPNSDTWNYWQNVGAWQYDSLQSLIASDAPWLKVCKVCKPTGWTTSV